MNKEFIPYEEALALKELGFDEPCFDRFYTKPNSKMFGIDEHGRHYPIKNTPKKLYKIGEQFALNASNVIPAPTFQQAFRWFRENHNLEYQIGKTTNGNYHVQIHKNTDEYLQSIVGLKYACLEEIVDLYTYEEAELACLRKLIEIVKQK